jgi:serine-type D-Ala-D-Ala carboxypeptidase (penicillin-binding protein 5/6)
VVAWDKALERSWLSRERSSFTKLFGSPKLTISSRRSASARPTPRRMGACDDLRGMQRFASSNGLERSSSPRGGESDQVFSWRNVATRVEFPAKWSVIAAVALICGQAFGQQAIAPPKLTASAVFVLNADTGEPLYHKNENQAVRILSITKLITAYVLVERLGGQLSDPVTITQAYLAGGSTAGLRKGDVWSLADLLYGMLLVSGNDAALAIADHVGRTILFQEKRHGSSIKRFVQEMRSAAAALGAQHTQFADPYGLSPSNVATARDVGLMGRTIFRDARLLPFWRCARRTLSIGGPETRTVTLNSTIEMIGEDDIIGAKTGSHVSKNIYHLVVGWRAPNGQTIVAVVLGSADHPSRYNDMRAILAALPHDFPELAEPAASSGAASQDSGVSGCL